MTSSSPNVGSSSKGGKIVAALTCPVCLDLCINPKFLPQCGHSLCAACLELIYKQYETGRSITSFPCPECRTENSVPTGDLDKFKVNYAVLRAVEVLRDEEKAEETAEPGVTCPHVHFLARSKLATCQHCDETFCRSCLSEHKELMKLEINFINCGLHDRFDGAVAALPEKVETIHRQIDENVRLVQEKLRTTSEVLLEAIRKIVLEKQDRLLEKAKLLGDELHSRLASEIETDATSSQQVAIDRRVKEINETSSLYASLEDFAQLHQLVIDQDKKISKLDVAQCQVAKSNIDITYDCSIVNKLTDLLDEKLDIRVMKEIEDDGATDEKSPYAYREVHMAAKSGDFAKLRSIFTRPNLPPTCQRFVVEHRDKNDKKRTLLHQVAEGGSLEGVRYLVTEQCANISAKDEDGDMAMHLAARANHPEIAKFLLDSKSRLANVRGRYDQSVLYIASGQAESLDLVRYLVDELKADIEQTNAKYNCSALMYAASKGRLNVVKLLCERGANLVAKDSDDYSALHLAANSGHLEVVKFLLEKSCVNLEWVNSNMNETPLCIAARKGHLDVVEYLVTLQRANLEHADSRGCTPLLLAANRGWLDVVKFLLKQGANLQAKTGERRRAVIHQAVYGGSVELVKFLADEFPDFLEMKDEDGGTALHFAAACGDFQMVTFLVEKYHVRTDVRDKFGMSPLFEAVRSSGRLPMVKYLLENGATLEDTDCDGGNVLHYALQSEDAHLIAFLLDRDPTLVVKPNKKGETPLQVAVKDKLPHDILAMMLEGASLFRS